MCGFKHSVLGFSLAILNLPETVALIASLGHFTTFEVDHAAQMAVQPPLFSAQLQTFLLCVDTCANLCPIWKL